MVRSMMLAGALLRRQHGCLIPHHARLAHVLRWNATTASKISSLRVVTPPGHTQSAPMSQNVTNSQTTVTGRPPRSKATAPSSGADLQKFQKMQLAQELFDAGNLLLYKATWQLSCFRFISYTIVAFLAGSLTYNSFGGFLDIRENARRGIGNLVIYTQLFTGGLLAAVAGFCLFRTGGQVESIQLLKKGGEVLLQIRTRQYLPFWRQTDYVRPIDLEAIPTVNRTTYPIPQSLSNIGVKTSSSGAAIISVLMNTPKHVARGLFWFIGGFRQFFGRASIITTHGYFPDSSKQETFLIDLHGHYPPPHDQNRQPYLFKLMTMKRVMNE